LQSVKLRNGEKRTESEDAIRRHLGSLSLQKPPKQDFLQHGNETEGISVYAAILYVNIIGAIIISGITGIEVEFYVQCAERRKCLC
jgi:hypothetical protein